MPQKRNHHVFNAFIIATTLSVFLVLSMGCSKSSQFPTTNTSTGSDNQSSGSTAPTDPGSTTTPGTDTPGTTEPTPPVSSYKMTALAWETSTKPERTKWSLYLQDILLNKWNSLLAGADDIETFCPKYYKLDNDQRANAWAALFVGVAKFESGYDPTMRFHESTMGTDGITGQPVYSEGLLQLSYQDIQGYPFCDFDWNKDKNLSVKDPKKDVLDPYKNLYCGVGIMAKIISRKGQITVSSGAYWSTLRSGGRYQHISEIAAIVKKLPFCN
ncbi:hypothetical protein [Bdellovibrio svalbardensis]|uniref:Transglycosylase SLT domain-containing protein n=1 Tax=Bdellovibrio svalbardensis TaxID=2972972 RepID=A0ABT6DIM9_9BACT|nr:hypothetical protein [Bdellovibrio svalbardensis]MDG0816700.1 hypothetical protein [Bdellovibrio svalbardensis]